jgi:preprotein translocase subunit Sss1
MSEKTMAEIGVNAKIHKESAVKHKTKKPAQKEKQYQKPTPHISKEIEKPTQSSFIHQLKSKPLLLVLIGLIVVAILAFALKGTSGGLSCSSVEECVDRMGQLQAHGDLDGVLAAMDKATSMVPRERHTDFAWIWCERAIVLEQLGKINQSDESREICAAWGRGE